MWWCGRVLAGFQVPADEHDVFDDFLERLGFTHFEETDNPAFQLFLGNASYAETQIKSDEQQQGPTSCVIG